MSIQWSNIVVQIGRFPDCQIKRPTFQFPMNPLPPSFHLLPTFSTITLIIVIDPSWIQESLKITTVTSRSTGCNVYIYIHRIYLYYHLRYWKKSFQRKKFPKCFFLKTRKNSKTMRHTDSKLLREKRNF